MRKLQLMRYCDESFIKSIAVVMFLHVIKKKQIK